VKRGMNAEDERREDEVLKGLYKAQRDAQSDDVYDLYKRETCLHSAFLDTIRRWK
jgi:hypothetical protein